MQSRDETARRIGYSGGMAKIIAWHSFGFIALAALALFGLIYRVSPAFWIMPGMFVAIFGWNLFWDLKWRGSEKPRGLLLIRFLMPKLILAAGLIALGVFNSSLLAVAFGAAYPMLILLMTACFYAAHRRSDQPPCA
jgi:hypothetical protein